MWKNTSLYNFLRFFTANIFVYKTNESFLAIFLLE
jgi:hypothetical protein